MEETLQVDTPGLEAAGTYSCIAQTDVHTLWSFDVEITVVKQPIITVSPQVYRAAEGATVIFSCIVDNIDGVRGQDWGVVYKIKEEDQEFEDVGLSYPSNEESLLYISQLQTSPDVRCETSPGSHVSPIYRDGKVEIVEQPPVSVSVITNKQRYTEGDTLIIRCVLLHDIPADSPVDVFWRHGDVKIVTTGGVGVLADGRVAERYFTTTANNQTTEVLFIEELTKKSAGKYTCVFDGGEKGRYEDSYEISVHPSTPVNTIAIIISVCFVLILIITMGVVLALIIRRSKTFTYAVAEKQGSPAMQNTAL
ncbi:uncharacterized protein LOC134816974 [Bolinopsis microptera]|uniref:uncharacterized protein LOC134816974 n=1 Tax=Bolinopsis microptera TaxID=2820187 RepID=UPI00307973B1